MTRVFVYGSLMRGFHNHRLLEDSLFEGTARTKETGFVMRSLGAFPGVARITFGAELRIRGEVYRVDDLTLARLDRLEGHPNFYEREVVELADGTLAWMYLLPYERIAHEPNIATGSWRRAS